MGGILGTGGDILPDYERVPVNDVQVSLHRLLKLLRSTGRSTGFLLSGAIVPIIDVRRLIEDEFAGSLDPSQGDTSEMYADIVGTGAAGFQAVCQIFNPLGSATTFQLLSARVNNAVGATFNGELHDGAFAVADANGVLVRGPAVLGSANDDCVARFFGNDGTALPTRLKVTMQVQMAAGALNANADLEFIERPLWLPPGRGWCVRNAANAAGTNMLVNFRWREFPRT
jgi:hypothetical protein